jgi:hypothetical protein
MWNSNGNVLKLFVRPFQNRLKITIGYPEINIRPLLAFRPFESARTDFVMLFDVGEADGHRAAFFRHRATHDELVATLVKLFFCVTNANDK